MIYVCNKSFSLVTVVLKPCGREVSFAGICAGVLLFKLGLKTWLLNQGHCRSTVTLSRCKGLLHLGQNLGAELK